MVKLFVSGGSAFGTSVARRFRLRLEGKRTVRSLVRFFWAVSLLTVAAIGALAEKRVALVIGNSSYALAPLDNPKNDADDVTAALQRLHFAVTELKDLTIREFDQAIDAFESTARGADVALFFFSGHGVQIDKRGYLAPIDIKSESESSAMRELEPIQEVVSRIEHAAKVSVIVLDACRDSPLQERLRRIAVEKNKGLGLARGLPPVSVVGSNTLIVYSTAPGETASDGTNRNSPFTASLLKNIETPGLEIELMFKRVTADVLSGTSGKQQPERLSRLQYELVLLPAKSGVRPLAPLSEAAQAWASIKDSNEPAVFEAFRKQYGQANPLYDTLGSQRIEELNRNKAASEGGSGSAGSSHRPEPERPKETQTAVAVPPKSAPAPMRPTEQACDDGLLVSVAQSSVRPCIKPGSGGTFKDCPLCPEMVVVPGGGFIMGAVEKEEGFAANEAPKHRVSFARPFAVSKFEVIFDEWDACVAGAGCGGYVPKDEGWGRGRRPVINVSWADAQDYVRWLSAKTGRIYRLLTEAEWEYSARAGSTSRFFFGDRESELCRFANGADANAHIPEARNMTCKDGFGDMTSPAGTFPANAFGLHDMSGNVWEWVEDCWHENYNGAPVQGSSWASGTCDRQVLRGGSWHVLPRGLRSAFRAAAKREYRDDDAGFRVARALTD